MVRHAIPLVIDDRLISSESTTQRMPTIEVGSEAWYAWLNEPDTHSFAFRSQQGHFTARREHSHSNWYWYAYRSKYGHLHKTYLGKSRDLTLERLLEAARLLSTARATHPQLPSPMLPAHLPAATEPSSHTSLPSIKLLTTKLSIPSAHLHMVPRPRLTQRMHAATQGPLTLLIAPAGWGKTTLLHTWYTDPSRSTWPLAWVSLDAGDNDPSRFWTYVITALNKLHPGVGEPPLALLFASPPPRSKLYSPPCSTP